MPGQSESVPTLLAVHDSLKHTCGVEQMSHETVVMTLRMCRMPCHDAEPLMASPYC